MPIFRNKTFEERFAYAGLPISDFDRKRFSRLGPEAILKVPTPILIASLPKSGTSSMWKYFLCGGHMAAHTNARVNQTVAVRIAECIEQNVQHGKPPFLHCGPYTVWSDAGTISFPAKRNPATTCFYPSIHALQALYDAYPTMTIVLMRRNVSDWIRSVSTFHGIATRWAHCNNTHMPQSEADLADFYHAHAQRIRNFSASHPSLTYVELPLESNDTGRLLQESLGIPAQCWSDCAPGKHLRHCKQARL